MRRTMGRMPRGRRGGAWPDQAAAPARRAAWPLLCLLLALAVALLAAGPGAAGPGSGEARYAASSGEQTGLPAPAPDPLAAPAIGPIPTAHFRDIWGTMTVDGRDAPVGTVVNAFNPRGDLVGSFTVREAGRYGYMRVYGEDTAAGRLVPGMRAGESPTLAVNGRAARVAAGSAVWQSDRRPDRLDLAATSN